MSILVFRRTKIYPDTPDGSFGDLSVDGQQFSKFVENADTLMPVGVYELVPHDSPHHPNTLAFVNPSLGVWHLPTDVPHEVDYHVHVRSTCLIHPANYPSDLEGCAAPGETIARFPKEGMGVTNSRRTMARLLELLKTRTGHTAEILEEYSA